MTKPNKREVYEEKKVKKSDTKPKKGSKIDKKFKRNLFVENIKKILFCNFEIDLSYDQNLQYKIYSNDLVQYLLFHNKEYIDEKVLKDPESYTKEILVVNLEFKSSGKLKEKYFVGIKPNEILLKEGIFKLYCDGPNEIYGNQNRIQKTKEDLALIHGSVGLLNYEISQIHINIQRNIKRIEGLNEIISEYSEIIQKEKDQIKRNDEIVFRKSQIIDNLFDKINCNYQAISLLENEIKSIESENIELNEEILKKLELIKLEKNNQI